MTLAPTWVALLRGINVGTAKRVAMSDLREVLSGLGYDDVRTHLQSGNAVFRAQGSERDVELAVSSAVAARFDLEVAVIVRAARELAEIIAGNPFLAASTDPSKLHVTFLAGAAAAAADVLGAVDTGAVEPDAFAGGDRVIYEYRPNGVRVSRLPDWQRVLGGPVTSRSWKTVTGLHDLASAPR